MSLLTQMKFSFISHGTDRDAFTVISFKGFEAISKPYEFEIILVSDDDDVDPLKVLQHPATFTIHRDGEENVDFGGILMQFEETQEFDGCLFYKAILAPKFWWLSLTHHNQVFLKSTVPEIMEIALKDGGLVTGIDFEFRLKNTYQKLEYVCQYDESHFDFVSRWAEREGIYYFFEQTHNGEKVIFTDTKISHVDLLLGKDLVYVPPSGLDAQHTKEVIKSYVCKHNLLPAGVLLKDYNYLRPSQPIEGFAQVDENGRGENYVYGVNFDTTEEGNRLAQIRAEALICRKSIFHGESSVPYMVPGFTFDLNDYYKESYNKKYLVTDVHHEGHQTGYLISGLSSVVEQRDEQMFYANSFTAIYADQQFRAEHLTHKPKISGTLHAKVDAEFGKEYAELDEQGRYKVRLPFDIDPEHGDGKASAYLRMMQPYAGSNRGMHFPLPKDTDVLLTFIDGNPDRPVIAGAVPNPETISPVTDKNQTESVIRSGGDNKIRIEDKKGDERIIMESPTANSWVRIGAPNDPPDPYQVFEGSSLEEYKDANGTWDLIETDNAGALHPTTAVAPLVDGDELTYKLFAKNLRIKNDTGEAKVYYDISGPTIKRGNGKKEKIKANGVIVQNVSLFTLTTNQWTAKQTSIIEKDAAAYTVVAFDFGSLDRNVSVKYTSDGLFTYETSDGGASKTKENEIESATKLIKILPTSSFDVRGGRSRSSVTYTTTTSNYYVRSGTPLSGKSFSSGSYTKTGTIEYQSGKAYFQEDGSNTRYEISHTTEFIEITDNQSNFIDKNEKWIITADQEVVHGSNYNLSCKLKGAKTSQNTDIIKSYNVVNDGIYGKIKLGSAHSERPQVMQTKVKVKYDAANPLKFTINGKRDWELDPLHHSADITINWDGFQNAWFCRYKDVTLEILDFKEYGDDTKEGIRMYSLRNLWLESFQRYAEYHKGLRADANRLTTPAVAMAAYTKSAGTATTAAAFADKPMIGDMLCHYGSDYKPTNLMNRQDGGVQDFDDALANAHVRVSSFDTFTTQEGNIYDFGGYWNYNLGNCYVEDHINQLARLNDDIETDLLNRGGPDWSALHWPTSSTGTDTTAANITWEPLQGATNDIDCSGDWRNGNIWVGKKFGNSYDYMDGNAVSIMKGDTLDIVRGGQHTEIVYRGGGSVKSLSIVGGNSSAIKEEMKWSSAGKKFYHYKYYKEGSIRVTSEKKYMRENGNALSSELKKETYQNVFTHSMSHYTKQSVDISSGTSNSVSISASAKADVNISASASAALNIQAAGSLSYTLSAGLDFKFHTTPLDIKLDNGDFKLTSFSVLEIGLSKKEKYLEYKGTIRMGKKSVPLKIDSEAAANLKKGADLIFHRAVQK